MTMHPCRARDCETVVASREIFCKLHIDRLPPGAYKSIQDAQWDARHNHPGGFERFNRLVAMAVGVLAGEEEVA